MQQHNNHVVFDFHEHHDTGHHYAVTHQHDDHPRHHHDKLGSILYLDGCGLHYNVDDHTDRTIVNDGAIGCGGSDYDRRTTTTTRSVAGDGG